MRDRVVPAGAMALAVTFTCLACSLTDLGGLSGGADPVDGGGSTSEAGVSSEASTSDAGEGGADAADPSAAYAAVVLADGPVAYFRFEEPADANAAKDKIGNLTAAATGAGVKFGQPGVRGSGVTFDTTAWLDVGDVFDFDGQKPFTIECWVRSLTGNLEGQIIHKRDQDANPFKGYILYADNNAEPHFEAWGVDMDSYSTTALATTWTHVVNVVSYATGKGNAKMYVNGVPSATGGYDNVKDLADTPAPLRFGVYMNGTLDEVAIYDKPLPGDRILEHYRAGR